MEKISICPSILSADFTCLLDEVNKVKNADMLHIDVMDGHFVPNISIGIPVLKSLSLSSSMFLDVHLMITNPLKYIQSFVDAGADGITFHIESDDDTKVCIEKIKSLGRKVGVALKPSTSAFEVKPYIGIIDMVLVMTVEPGFGGQKFMPDMLNKVKDIREYNSDLNIQVDGGINLDTAKHAAIAGANILVAGSAIFGSNNPANMINSLRDVSNF